MVTNASSCSQLLWKGIYIYSTVMTESNNNIHAVMIECVLLISWFELDLTVYIDIYFVQHQNYLSGMWLTPHKNSWNLAQNILKMAFWEQKSWNWLQKACVPLNLSAGKLCSQLGDVHLRRHSFFSISRILLSSRILSF